MMVLIDAGMLRDKQSEREGSYWAVIREDPCGWLVAAVTGQREDAETIRDALNKRDAPIGYFLRKCLLTEELARV